MMNEKEEEEKKKKKWVYGGQCAAGVSRSDQLIYLLSIFVAIPFVKLQNDTKQLNGQI